MAGVGTTNISFSGLRTAWGNASYAGGSDPGATDISLSEFHGATFTDGNSAPTSGEISISDFSGKTFGTPASGNVIYESGDFRGYTTEWSTHPTYLKGINASTTAQTYTGSTDITGKTIQLLVNQGTVYSSILLSPNSSTETPGMVVDRTESSPMDEATIWFYIRSGVLGTGGVVGIIPLDLAMSGTTTKDKWTNQKTYIHNKFAQQNDRIALSGALVNWAGSRDDITSSTTIVSPQFKTGTYGTSLTNSFHNITGVSAGTCGSSNISIHDRNRWFFTQDFTNFGDYTVNGVNIGMKIKWYEMEIQCSLTSGSSIIKPVYPATTWSSSELTDLFSGMYVTGTGINSSDGPFVGDIHTNYMRLYKGKGTDALEFSKATSTQTNVTLTISGYLFWGLGTTSIYSNPKILGPPHTVLPKYQAYGTNLVNIGEIKEWAFFASDSTNANNTFEFDIRNTEPSGTAFSYSVTYSLGTIPIENILTTDKFRAYDNWSSHSSSLRGISGPYIATGNTYMGNIIANKRVRLYSTGQSTTISYPILIFSPNTSSSSDPGIIVDRANANAVDEATLWLKVISQSSYNQLSFGIIAKDMTLNSWSSQKSYLEDKHSNYGDRLSFHGAGYNNYAGSRDDITSSSTIVSPQYATGTYGSNLTTYFHTRSGRTAGTQRSFNAVETDTTGLGTNVFFFKNSYYNYTAYRSNTLYPNHGLKIKWYETTIQCSLTSGSNVIQPVSPPSNWSSSDLTDVFAGMYIYGTGINSNDGAFIADVHTNYMVMYKQKGTSSTSLVASDATSTQTNVTLTISGYLFWTLTTSNDSVEYSSENYHSCKIMGPPHQVLPKYQTSGYTSAPSTEIKEWAFYIGDSASSTSNSFTYDIRHTEPRGIPFSYSVSYSSGTIPSASNTFNYYWKYYAYGSTIGTMYVYWYSGTTLNLLRSVSGQQHTGTGQTWNSYTENLTNYAGQTGYIVYAYQTGSNFYNDPQIDDMYVTKNSSTLASIGPSTTAWKRYATGSATTNTITYTTSLSIPSITSANWVELLTNQSTTYGWQVDSGGTPSVSTGNIYDASGSTTGTYIYFEGSSPNFSSSAIYYWLRTANSITLS